MSHPKPIEPSRLWDLGAPGTTLRAAAWTSTGMVAAVRLADKPGGSVRAQGRWATELAGAPGALAARDARVVATEQASTALASALWLDAATGAITRRTALRSTEFVVVVDVAICEDGAALAGSFGGTLRVGDREVSSGGQRDGFVARLDGAGAVTSLLRMGGPGDDGFTAVDCKGDQVAAVGTFSAGAELRGVELPRPGDHLSEHQREPSIASDALVMMMRGDELAWRHSFGGSQEDLPADVVITERGEVAVVGMARGELQVGDVTHQIHGPADGYLARWSAAGEVLGSLRLGGGDYDATTRVAAVGDTLVIAGFFSGTVDIDGARLAAQGGDDAMLVLVAPGAPTRAIAIAGPGREEIVSLAAAGRGVVVGVVHTAGLAAFGLAAPAPADPLGGAAALLLSAL